MAEKKTDLMTAGDIAKALKAPDARVKKAIKDLALQPAAKRGVCNLYAKVVSARKRSSSSGAAFQ